MREHLRGFFIKLLEFRPAVTFRTAQKMTPGPWTIVVSMLTLWQDITRYVCITTIGIAPTLS